MAKQIWNNPIDKNVDWGGDANTDGLPVSGQQVQKFIKDTFEKKAGVFFYDTTNNRYLVFADEDAKNAYLEDTTQTDLVLGTFDAPFNYTAEINLATPTYNAIFLGSTGNYIEFTFDIKNKQGASTMESAVVTFTIIRNATKQVFTQKAMCGDSIRFKVDDYLGEGSNTIIVGISGQTSLAATTVAVTYNVVNLQIVDETDISVAYDLSSGSKALETGVTVNGTGTKIVEWYLDGVMLDFVKSEDEIIETEGYRPKSIELSNLQQGRHSLQIRAYTTVNGEVFYTPTLYRDIMVYTGADSNTIMAISMEIPPEYGIVTDSPILYGLTQYVPYTLNFATYSPTNKENVLVTVSLDGETLGSVNSKNGIVNEFTVVPKTSGSKSLTIAEETSEYAVSMVVTATTMSIEEITTGLTLDFSAIGMTDDSWSYGDYSGTFEGFNWNAASGWVNNRLHINAGASFSIDYAPLSGKPTEKGRTLEFEFKTTNVNDDDAVICDLRNDAGVGLLITATKIKLVSENGVVLQNEFKADEDVRVAIVINRATGSTRKCLSFMYANGSVSRCKNWDVTDGYESDAQLSFVGSAGAEVQLKAIRIYEVALTDDQVLNNYILYRDTVTEMMNVYERNDIYAEGTSSFSPDKMVSRLPVMIITGNIPTLENTSDKDTQIIVDIEYNNLQDPTRSFKMTGAAMRPQGTSSMGYPKKNFRIYTQKVEDTTLYDANGNIVEDKLYSFKEGAIPVDCWCLKADYAESSGTHNTGIARMWNKALYNMQVDGQYVCRTDAQKAALAAGYAYDVRTTIDGFPILLFYRLNASDEPVFIGKYNFNNDKSTEKVFGFTDIPGFDNSRMQCWEVLNNGNAIGLFTDVSDFYSSVTIDGETKMGWELAFESRYPDTKTPVTEDLYNFAVWLNGVNGDAERFATEKWDHFKVYPLAAYYCYIMRHAAADQLVKNAMLTSEDGEHFYFIQYDNDTINGLINTGDIDILPTDDRNSVDESGEYKFAGHSSVLWNMLEADTEFMQIVKTVDNALYSAGISYDECIRIFDEEQADKWVERVYNQDSEYKYVGPYVNSGINNLFMLQGKRDLHRRWWLSKRFSIYDAKFVSGEYKSQAVELKCMNDTPAGQQFSITAGYPLDYGYGINNLPRESGISLEVGESHEFTTSEVVNLGDPIRIYGAPNIAELDLSKIANRLALVNIANVNSSAIGTKLEKLTIGGEGISNIEVYEISGLMQATKLTHLDIRGMMGIESINLSNHPYFEEMKATGTKISSVSLTKGAPVNRLELPATMKTLDLDQLPYLTTENLVLEDVSNIHTISVKSCPNLSEDFSWIENWYNSKNTADDKCSLTMNNILWSDVNPESLVNLTKLGSLNLRGKVVLSEISLEYLEKLIDAFGETAFSKDADFYIDAPPALLVSGRTQILAGESETYTAILFGAEELKTEWSVVSGSNSYATFDTETNTLTTSEGYGSGTFVIRTTMVTDNGTKVVDTSVSIVARTYPTSSNTSLVGNTQLESEYETYVLEYPDTVTGDMTATWTLTGFDGYAEIESSDDKSCVIKTTTMTSFAIEGTLKCVLTKKYNSASLFTLTKTITMINESIAETDKGVCAAVYAAGLCANEGYITKDEAKLILDSEFSTISFTAQKANIKSFNGLKYFSITTLPNKCFYQCTKLTSVTLPSTLTSLSSGCFSDCSSLASINIPEGVTSLSKNCFSSCSSLTSIDIPEGVTSLSENCFYKCSSLTSVTLPSTLTSLGDGCFSDCSSLTSIDIPEGVTSIGNWCFYECSSLTSIDIPEGVTSMGARCFWGCSSLASINIPEGVTNLGEYFFYECSSLTSIDIPEGVISLGKYCFYKCSSLTSITLPSTLRQLDSFDANNVFSYCQKLEITVSSNNGFFMTLNGVLYSKDGTRMITYAKDEIQPNFVVPEGVTSFGDMCFSGCSSLTSVTLPSTLTSLGENCFSSCSSLTSIDIPEGVTSLGENCFYKCSSLTSITLPSTLTSLGDDCFYYCSSLKRFVCHCVVAPQVGGTVFGSTYTNSTLVGRNTYNTGENELIVPMGATGYDLGQWYSPLCSSMYCGFTLKESYEPQECTSLVITADDVIGNKTSTMVYYTAITNGYDALLGENVTGVTITGAVISDEFPQNTSYTETVEREVSFTYLGVTATTTITQGVYVDKYYTLDLNNGQWAISDTVSNPDSTIYDGVYQSVLSKGVNSGYDIMYIDINEYSSFKFYIRSYGESSYDYMMVSQLDQTITSSTSYSNTTLVKAHTYGKATSGTAISNYTLVEFTDIDTGSHRITIIYRKDGSGNNGDDRGYVLIPKEQ